MEINKKIKDILKDNSIFTDIFALVIFFIFSIFIFRYIFLNDGILYGGDWGLPYTNSQIQNYFTNSTNTWQNNNFGSRNSVGISVYIFSLIILIINKIGINAILFSKLLVLFLFTFSGFNLYKLLKFFNLNNFSSIISGLIYITTPLFFDYTVLGWDFVILTMMLFPIVIKYFIKSIKYNDVKNNIVLYFLIFFSIQSQSIIWYFIAFFALSIYLINNKKTLKKYIINIALITVFYLLLNSPWLLGILFYKDTNITGANIVYSSESMGTVFNFTPKNIIRLFGSLYNFQYEHITEQGYLKFAYFVLPMLAFSSLLNKENNKLKLSFFLIAISPFFFYLLNLNRVILNYIPFSNVIRDLARFSTLSTFAYPILVGFTLNTIINKTKWKNKIIIYLFITLILFILIKPWLAGDIAIWKPNLNQYQVLRLKKFPESYINLENNFNDNFLDKKSLFLPIGGIVEYKDDIKFHGAYQGGWDLFSYYSKTPCIITTTDKDNNAYINILGNLLNSKNILNAIKYIDNSNIQYLTIRTNMKLDNSDEIIKAINQYKKFVKYFSSNEIVVYKKNNNNFLPHFYTPQTIIKSSQNISILPDIVSKKDYNIRSATYFSDNTYNSEDKTVFDSNSISKTEVKNTPIIEFKKVNPTKYKVVVHGASSEFPLIFSESFHDGWKAYLGNFKTEKSEFKNEDYKILDGNSDDQASLDELESYIDSGYISSIGNLKQKNIKHVKWENNKEVFDYNEPYKIDFVSKNFNGTIQNDNLDGGRFYETWFKTPISDSNHSIVNGYANSWNINPDSLCNNNSKCIKNADGSYDMEFTIEFWPQRLFYIGLFISGTTLVGCVVYLILDQIKILKLKNSNLKTEEGLELQTNSEEIKK